MKRREFIAAALATTAAAAPPPRIRLGTMDGVLRLRIKPEIFGVAKGAGVEGVELSCGTAQDGRLELADPALQQTLLAEAKKHEMAVAGVVLNILHINTLKNDPLGRKWMEQGIAIAQQMKA